MSVIARTLAVIEVLVAPLMDSTFRVLSKMSTMLLCFIAPGDCLLRLTLGVANADSVVSFVNPIAMQH